MQMFRLGLVCYIKVATFIDAGVFLGLIIKILIKLYMTVIKVLFYITPLQEHVRLKIPVYNTIN